MLKRLLPRAGSRRRWFPPDEFYTAERCARCGICCGATDGHPCERLRWDAKGMTSCEIYDTRLGPHRTTTGMAFVCVPIQKIIEMNGGYASCSYVREIIRRRREMGQDADDLGRLTEP